MSILRRLFCRHTNRASWACETSGDGWTGWERIGWRCLDCGKTEGEVGA